MKIKKETQVKDRVIKIEMRRNKKDFSQRGLNLMRKLTGERA
jgi:hypothetical protein